jgi:hypothetical protein
MNIAERVNDIIQYCLYNDEYVDETCNDDKLLVEGICTKYLFKPSRIQEKRNDIKELLNEMHPNFHVQHGGGWSFLNFCSDKNDKQWADLHKTADSLVSLGIAAGMVSFLLPRNKWELFPGSMPYIQINTEI